jgi:DNA-binding NarL/FixJ family response regulator
MSSRWQAAAFEIVGQANSVEMLRQLLARQTPDVVLLDWDLPDREEETLKTLVREVAGRPIVIISPPQPPEVILAALQSGVKGCLSYNLSSEDFVDRLRLLAGGDLFISGDISNGLEQQLTATESADTQDTLSEGEREVLSLVAYGSTNREIAVKLIVTENTVKVHLRHILRIVCLQGDAIALGNLVGISDLDAGPCYNGPDLKVRDWSKCPCLNTGATIAGSKVRC